jgi:hypothetical protein
VLGRIHLLQGLEPAVQHDAADRVELALGMNCSPQGFVPVGPDCVGHAIERLVMQRMSIAELSPNVMLMLVAL